MKLRSGTDLHKYSANLCIVYTTYALIIIYTPAGAIIDIHIIYVCTRDTSTCAQVRHRYIQYMYNEYMYPTVQYNCTTTNPVSCSYIIQLNKNIHTHSYTHTHTHDVCVFIITCFSFISSLVRIHTCCSVTASRTGLDRRRD